MNISTSIQNFTDCYQNHINEKDSEDYYNFHLEIRKFTRMCIGASRYTMDLDEEDIKYLYDKYSKKVSEEFQSNIEEITKLYNQLFPDEKNY